MRAAALILLAACSARPPAPEATATAPAPRGADLPIVSRGRSCDSAVAVDSKARQRAFIDENYPGATVSGEARTECNGKPADAISIITANGQSITLYFDVSGMK